MDKKQFDSFSPVTMCDPIQSLFQVVVENDPSGKFKLQIFPTIASLIKSNTLEDAPKAIEMLECLCRDMRELTDYKPRIIVPWTIVLTALQIKIINQWMDYLDTAIQTEWKERRFRLATNIMHFTHLKCASSVEQITRSLDIPEQETTSSVNSNELLEFLLEGDEFL